MMSTCLIGFLLVVGVLGESKIYQNLVYFTRIEDFTLKVNGRMGKSTVKEHSLMEKGNGKETSM